ncbi:MAG: GNAT family N-acetyltransferase [Planctomycetes bacterium]|nr:GNAT family N-acetyltransferase [Planctomycetota bacterium]
MTTIRRIQTDSAPLAAAQVRRLLDYVATGSLPNEHLWGAFDARGEIHHAAVVLPQTGRTGLVFTSRLDRRRDVAAMAELIDAAVADLPPSQVTLAQALIDPDDDLRLGAFDDAGFTTLTTLCYLQTRVPGHAQPPALPADVTFESYQEARVGDFVSVLDASYERTLDCPALQGLRCTPDVLAGHRATGVFDPALWTLLRIGGKPAGVILLNPVPAAQCVELVYLGIGAAYRGRGLGALLMQRGLHLCAQRDEPYITLAVDETNAPAMTLYKRFGFRRLARKVALIRSLHRASTMTHA